MMETEHHTYADSQNLPAVLKVKELANFLRMPLGRTYDLIARGEIPCVRFGRSIRIPRKVVEDLLDVGHGTHMGIGDSNA